jgi:hypothetical protein
MAKYNPEHKRVVDDILEGNPFVRPGKMFGYPAYYVGKKLCICLYEDGVGLKLPGERVESLLVQDPNTIPFQPLGKPKMREWVQINLKCSEEYRDYLPVFEESILYLVEIQNRQIT